MTRSVIGVVYSVLYPAQSKWEGNISAGDMRGGTLHNEIETDHSALEVYVQIREGTSGNLLGEASTGGTDSAGYES